MKGRFFLRERGFAALKVFKVLKDLNDFKEIFAFHPLIRIFGFALDTPARECSNKFDIPLAYSYLCTIF